MVCPRCLRYQRYVRLNDKSITGSRRNFSTTQAVREETATSPAQDQSLGLSILEHKRRPVRAPNDKVRSAVHAIEVSTRLGTRYARPIIGAMEWQTSTYHYNKQTTQAYPVLANTTNKLLEAYAALQKVRVKRDGTTIPATKGDIAKRRKEAARVYMSDATVKDYGNKIVINAFVHDAVEDARLELSGDRRPRTGQKNARGAGAGGASRGRPQPPRGRFATTAGRPSPPSPGMSRSSAAGPTQPAFRSIKLTNRS